MLYGKKPFGDQLSQESILEQQTIVNSKLSFPDKPTVSAETKAFIGRCLSRDPSNRPAVMEIFQDPFFTDK
jgi:tousled-like kinase